MLATINLNGESHKSTHECIVIHRLREPSEKQSKFEKERNEISGRTNGRKIVKPNEANIEYVYV